MTARDIPLAEWRAMLEDVSARLWAAAKTLDELQWESDARAIRRVAQYVDDVVRDAGMMRTLEILEEKR